MTKFEQLLEAAATTPSTQCAEVYWRGSSGSFCVRRRDHSGDHRGSGAQWTQDGKRISPPTLNEHGEPK